jgi:hypothetical protein
MDTLEEEKHPANKWEYQKKGTSPLFGYLNYFLNIEFS